MLTVGAEASAVGADPVVLAAVVAQPHAAPVALPALRADAVTRLAGPVRTAIQAATLWKENDAVKSRFSSTLMCAQCDYVMSRQFLIRYQWH